ncbi:hypothetical protein ACTHUE_09715, partial [Neisseria sp. P0021.S005]|uniref:hypothetical protein n=1 Tax=Neisseria sp. P0021.S005 TaxID=3436820 RepID=UPI003F7F612F
KQLSVGHDRHGLLENSGTLSRKPAVMAGRFGLFATNSREKVKNSMQSFQIFSYAKMPDHLFFRRPDIQTAKFV